MKTSTYPAWLSRTEAAPVPVTGNCSLGRAVGNDVVLVDDRVSRRHATIHVQGEREFWLVDLGSRNGTYLNGRRVSQPTRLRDGDRVQVGPFALTFHVGVSGGETALGLSGAEQTQADLRSAPCWLLVADIAGSTALSRERSAEELAVLVGGWFGRCKEAIEENGGTINKYLGDGFLAYWLAEGPALAHVAQALRDLARLQEERRPAFRVVVHRGGVMLGGIPSSGEESLAGPEVTFIFRLEKVAARLGRERLASGAAAQSLEGLLAMSPAGTQEVPGFEGAQALFGY